MFRTAARLLSRGRPATRLSTVRTGIRILCAMSRQDAPWCPPIVRMSSVMVGHLLAWEMHERDGSWHAWVS
jgi:hypothetical protein